MVIFLYLMIHLWLWIVLPYQDLNNMEEYNSTPMVLEDIFKPNFPATSEANYKAITLLDDLLEEIQFTDKRHELLNLFRQIETGGWDKETQTVEFPYGDRTQVSSAKAKGVYQFKDEEANVNAVKTAKTRAKELGIDGSYVDLVPNNPRQWTDDEADVMALANLFNQVKNEPGYVDEMLVQAFGGNREKMQEAYRLHHTSLDDPGTQARLDKIIPLK